MKCMFLKEIVTEVDKINQGFIQLGLTDSYYIYITSPFSKACYIIRDFNDLENIPSRYVDKPWDLVKVNKCYEQINQVADYAEYYKPIIEYEHVQLFIKKEG